MAIKEVIINEYKKILYVRQDDNGNIFYFSSKDFPSLNAHPYIIKSSKGHNIKGYFYYYDNPIKNRIVVFEHGMGAGHKAYMKEIEKLAKHGYLVFAYDHTGCVESEGDSVGGFSQSLVDLDDVIKKIKTIKEISNYAFSIVGHSMGGYSTLNIVSFHKDIKHIVAISPMISVQHMLNQIFSGFKRMFKKHAYNLEKENNPNYVDNDVIKGLKDYQGNALIIHSIDDTMALYKYHFKTLYKKLKYKENFSFILTSDKNHNPNYTKEAIEYKDKFFKEYKQMLKEDKLNTLEEKESFKAKYDWNKMTMQDDSIWHEIFKVLEMNNKKS